MRIEDVPYVVIADNEIQCFVATHEDAQSSAEHWSNERYDTAKVVYLPNRTVQGIWHKGVRVR